MIYGMLNFVCVCVGIKCDRLNAYGVTARVVFLSLSLAPPCAFEEKTKEE